MSKKQWLLTKQFRFEAAHQLPNHDGKCQRLHGHSWVGEVTVKGDALYTEGPKTGMLIDFGDLKAAITPLVENNLDHHYLNDSTGLKSPTSEEIARWIYDQLEPVLPGLNSVTIEETCTSRCVYGQV